MKRNLLLSWAVGLVLATTASATMVRQEWWYDGTNTRQGIINYLVNLADPVPPPSFETIQQTSAFTGSRDQYIAKFYGWVTVPATGTYQFHYACDDYGMLYVSPDEEMANAVEVAYVDGWTNIAEWNKYPATQHSAPMQLAKGQVLAVMAFFNEEGGGDNMDIGWTGPGLSSNVNSPTYLTNYITHIPPAPTKAKNPSPETGAVDVPRDADLSWTAGKFAVRHDIYLGLDYADVNEASRADPRGVLVSQGQTTATYDPGFLEFGQTYYWRVDEVNAVPTTIFKGKIWEFTVEPFAYPVEGIVATSSAVSQAGSGLENILNGSGLNAAGAHSVEAQDMWLTAPGQPVPIEVLFEFPQIYKLHAMRIWNYNVQFEPMLGFGCKDVTIEYSIDEVDWMLLGDVEFARAPAKATYTANTSVAFGGIPVKYVRLTIRSGWGSLGQFGLSEIEFMQVPAHPREPVPDEDETGVSVRTALSWRAGREAVAHEVYFGTDPEDLALAGTVNTARYSPGALLLETAYYWQIVEVNEADEVSAWPGALWSFTTEEFVVVDDFESYTDDDGAAIFDRWEDGWVNDTGSTVGNLTAPFAERTVVRSGEQSMPLTYANTGGPTISEAKLPLSQDWTTSGITTLSIAFAGLPGNTGQLYVKINNVKVPYQGVTNALALGAWQVWNIDLTTIGNVSNIRSLTIGIEGAGAKGKLYIDDIRLYARSPEFIVPVQPEADGLVAHYPFDEGSGAVANDASGNGNRGTVSGNPKWITGVIGGALEFDGVDDFVNCGKAPSLVIRDAITISCWIKVASFTRDWETILAMGDDSYRMSRSATNGNSVHFGCNGPTGGNLDGTVPVTTNTWRHAALVYDGVNKYVYIDGLEASRVASTGRINASAYNLHIGQNSQQTGRQLKGAIDDVRIYNRALSAAEVAGLARVTGTIHKPF